MNKYLRLFLLLGIISFESQAQSPFPLAKGNVLYYTYSCLWCQQPVPAPTKIVRVIGDTLMPNGKQYWILDPSDLFNNKFIRSDSNYIYYWTHRYWLDTVWYEQRTFNFNAKALDVDTISINGFSIARADDPISDILFNKPTTFYVYNLGGLIFGSLSIANGFGYTSYEYRGDEMPPFDDWTLAGCVISGTLYGSLSSVISTQELPAQLELFQNYPNPFNGWTVFQYRIAKNDHVVLTISNILGQQVAVVIDEVQAAGQYTAHFHPTNLTSGIYFCRLSTSTAVQTVRFVYLK